jgi:hypothetical protein
MFFSGALPWRIAEFSSLSERLIIYSCRGIFQNYPK